MSVDIILPTYMPTDACVDMTLRFFDSVHRHATGRARVIWVDNGSSDEGVARVRSVMGANDTLLRQRANLGFPRAVNIGLRESTAAYVVIANNDVTVQAGAIDMLRRVLDGNPQCAVAAPISTSGWQYWAELDRYLGLGGLKALGRLPEYEEKAAWLAQAYGDISQCAGMVAFFFAMIPRWALTRLGLLDERYGMGFAEDDDWCERARREGYEVRLSLGAFVTHDHRATWRSFMSDEAIAALQAENAAKLAAKMVAR